MATAVRSSSALQGMFSSPESSNPASLPLHESIVFNSQSREETDLIHDMERALKALKASDEAHRAIIELISFTAKPKVIQATFCTDVTQSAAYAAELKDILDRITEIAEDSHETYLDYSISK